MEKTALRIETILAKDLYTFYCNYVEHAEGQQISPISKYRALSQSQSPCAEEGDVGLLVAYIGDQCVGYQGILPGWLRTPNGPAKVYWGTASYVLPEFRKRMVAVQLIRKLISLRKDLLVTYFNKPLADLFKGLHFEEIPPLEYLAVRIDGLDVVSRPFRRFYRLQKRWPALRKIAEAAIRVSRRWCYPPIRAAYHWSLARRSDRALQNVRWQEVPLGKLSSDDAFGAPEAIPRFERDAKVINWMVEFPWIQDGGPVTHPSYFFSESYDSFRYFTRSLNDADGKQIGFVVLSRAVEKGTSKLKVLDFSCGQRDYRNLFWVVCEHAAQFQVDEIELPLQMEPYAASLPFASLVTKREQRRYLCYPYSKDSPLAIALPGLALHLTDGDGPFT
jgi:hypothetical protein